jgi:hypothetical protein
MSVFVFMFPSLPDPNDLVDVGYIAERTGLSSETILGGKAGTGGIPVAIRKPRRWRRGDVDEWLASLGRPQEQRGRSKRISLVRRKTRAA